jgi:endo-1,4-beta-xylanase
MTGIFNKFIQKTFIFAIFTVTLLSCDFSFKKDEAGEDPTWETVKRLKDVHKNNFLMGNIISPGDIGTVRFNILKRHYNTATAENHMKPDHIAPFSEPATSTWAYRFTDADKIVNAVRAEGMKMHGHTLIWHSQTPEWLTAPETKEEVLDNLEKYCREVATHFKGKLLSWDVVNEAIRQGLTSSQANGDWKECLRKDNPEGSPWNRAIGPEYIEKAFFAVRKADPDVLLYYNDYNLNDQNKATAVYNMVNDINKRYPNVEGRPLIDGIGMQSHHHINTNPQTVENSILLFTSLGVDVAITELDIEITGSSGSGGYEKQADQYTELFRIFIKYSSNISRVTFWGLDDGTSWRIQNNPTAYATLLDKDYGLKPAFYAVLNAK